MFSYKSLASGAFILGINSLVIIKLMAFVTVVINIFLIFRNMYHTKL